MASYEEHLIVAREVLQAIVSNTPYEDVLEAAGYHGFTFHDPDVDTVLDILYDAELSAR